MKVPKFLSLCTLSVILIIASSQVVRGQTGNYTRSVAWSTDGSQLAVARQDGTVLIQDANIGQTLFILQGDNSGATTSLAFSSNPDVNILASGGADAVVRIWNTDTGTLIRELPGHSIIISDLAWHPANPVPWVADFTAPPNNNSDPTDGTQSSVPRPFYCTLYFEPVEGGIVGTDRFSAHDWFFYTLPDQVTVSTNPNDLNQLYVDADWQWGENQ